jgi:hypothetical protein
MLDRLSRHLSEAPELGDLVKTLEGRRWWRENGDSIAVFFDLAPRSQAIRRLRASFCRKGSS